MLSLERCRKLLLQEDVSKELQAGSATAGKDMSQQARQKNHQPLSGAGTQSLRSTVGSDDTLGPGHRELSLPSEFRCLESVSKAVWEILKLCEQSTRSVLLLELSCGSHRAAYLRYLSDLRFLNVR